MSDLQHRVEALEQQALTATSPVRLNLAQLGIIIGSIACAVWWASLHVATKDDVKVLEDRLTTTATSLREVSTTLAVLKDRSDRQNVVDEEAKNSFVSRLSSPAAEIPERDAPKATPPRLLRRPAAESATAAPAGR